MPGFVLRAGIRNDGLGLPLELGVERRFYAALGITLMCARRAKFQLRLPRGALRAVCCFVLQ
jgi:hypothetical protein